VAAEASGEDAPVGDLSFAALEAAPAVGEDDLAGSSVSTFEDRIPIAPAEGRWRLAAIAGGLLLVAALVAFFQVGGGEVVAGMLATPTPSATPTRAATPTPALTPTNTGTPAPTLTPTRTFTPAPTGSPAPTPTITLTGPQQIGALWKQLDAAWNKPDWPAAIAILERVVAIDPKYDSAGDKLFAAHFNYGVLLVRSDQMEPAVAQFDAALAIFPNDVNARGERLFAQLYWDASKAYNAENWAGAIEQLTTIFKGNPAYKKTRQLLYASYYNDGFYLEKAGNLAQAKARYQQALAVYPQGGEASVALTRVTALLKLPTPTPTRTPVAGKNIEVNLTTFRTIARDGPQKVYDFLVGTGEPAKPTGAGNFEVLDKIPLADDVTRSLQMPFWMGIYWSGSIENGFHGLPVNRSGQKMWGGYLGTQISWGCIVLSDQDAETLYNWADVGIPVWVHY
jgi:tetratricopeptide (TPR) repeat protein